MNWLAIIVITTNVGGTQYMESIPVPSRLQCDIVMSQYVRRYNAAPASYFYECVDIGAIVRGAK